MRRLRKQPAAGDAEWSALLAQGGCFARVVGGRLFRVVDRPFKMYFVGLLFGLGFDTATEIALLALAAIQVRDFRVFTATLRSAFLPPSRGRGRLPCLKLT